MSYYSDIFGRAADTVNEVEAFAAGKAAANSGTSQPVTVGPVNSTATDVEQKVEPVVKKPATPVQATQDYLADWGSGISVSEAALNSDRSYAEIIRDRERWARETGGAQMDIFEFFPLNGTDLTKSAKQNEEEEKKLANKQKWEQISNVLSHLGNFVGAMSGAPSQTIESSVELSKRQQILRDKTVQLRQSNNQYVLANILKQRAEERAAQVAAQSAAYQNARLSLDSRKQDEAERQHAANEAIQFEKLELNRQGMSLKEKELKIKEALGRGRLSKMGAEQALINARILEAEAKSGGTVTETTDADGETKRVVRKPLGKGKGYGSDNGKGRGY